MTEQRNNTFTKEPNFQTIELNPDLSLNLTPATAVQAVLTFTYAGTDKPIAGVKIVMTEADGTVTILTTDINGQVTLPTTSNTYTLAASLTETGEDPVDLLDAIWILQHSGELRTLTPDQLKAADVNGDGEVDLLDAIQILQHSGELRTLSPSLIFLDANTGKPLSETTFNPGDTPSVTVIRTGDVDQGFDPTAITDHAPILTGKTTLSIDENETAVSTLVGKDADGDTLTYEITGGVDKDLFAINASTGALSFIAGPDYEDPSDTGGDNLYDIEITVSDGVNTTTQALIISVADVGEAIALTNKTINENAAGATVGDLSIIDTAFGNTNITYALSGDDAEFFVLDGNTLKLKSDVSADYETKSSYTLTVTATNSAGETVEEKVVVKIANVNETPVLVTALTNQSHDEDSALSFTVPITTFSDVDGDTLTYSATLSDGSALPSWLSFNTSTRVFTGTPVNADVGAISVKVTASDGSLSASDTFTLTVVNTNDDPTAVTLSATAIDENDTGGVIGTLTTTDDDSIHGDSHTYTLSGADADAFEVVNGQLKLKSSVSANFENQSTYAVTVTSTDGSGSTTAQSFSISINDVNEAPTNITLSAVAIDENASGGTVLGSVGASDEDTGDTITFSISGSDHGYFEIVNGQVQVKSAASINFEENSSLSITINATDSGGLTSSKDYIITVNDVNDVPTGISLSSYGIRDDVDGAIVGNITTADEDSGDEHTYTISDDRFEVVDDQLKLKAGNSVQYDAEKTITFTITTTDTSGETWSQEITINVGSIVLSSTSFAENTAGSEVGNLTIIDTSFSSNVTYTLSGSDADYFEIVDAVLKLKDSVSADFESKSTYSITITAADDANHEVSIDYSILVTDNNDTPTVANAIADQSIDEDSQLSFAVPANTFDDVDAGDSLTYAATLSDGSTLPSWLSFNTSTQTFSGTPLNANVGAITVKVTATDGSAATVSDTFTITIANTNDDPTLANAITDQSIDEDSALSFAVPANTFDDVDAGDSLTYAATLGDGSTLPSWLSFNASTRTFTGTPLNANVGSITVKVTVTDGSAATVSDTFTITVDNTNDTPTVANAITDQSIDEDSALSFAVPANTFDDVDAGDSLTYAATLGDGSALPSWLSFNTSTLAFSGTPLNANVGAITVKVTATDGSAATVSDTFTITVANTNDAPTAIALSATTINENSAGAVVGTLSTTDVDAGDSHDYTLSGDDASYFEVVNNQLKLKDSVSANYESKSTYAVTVTSTDSGSATTSESFTVTISDVNEAPTAMALSNASVDESQLGKEIGTVSVTDPDSGNTFTYSLSGTHQAWFEITSGGVLKLKDDTYADYEWYDSMSVTVTATDQGGLTYAKTFSIAVNDLAYATPYAPDLIPWVGITATGDAKLDSMLFAYAFGKTWGESLTITYSIITTDSVFASDYLDGTDYSGAHENIVNATSAMITAVEKAFDLISQYTGITFVKVTETATQCGDIRIGVTSSSDVSVGVSIAGPVMDSLGYAGAGNIWYNSANGDIWINNSVSDFSTGGFGYYTVIHEIGHSLGLKHPHDTINPNASDWTSPALSLTYDHLGYTVMAYRDYPNDGYQGAGEVHSVKFNDGNGVDFYNYTYMTFDIWALRYLYSYDGSSYQTPDVTDDESYGIGGTGDNTYTISGTNATGSFSIFDTGGTDTLDFSSLSLGSTINLVGGASGTLSYIGSNVIEYDGGEYYTGLIIGIYYANSIENVNAGSGNDTITCNVAINVINCGAGNDWVYDVGTGDTVYGDAGNDTFGVTSYAITLIDGGKTVVQGGIDGSNDEDALSFAASSIDLRIFTDAQITGIEQIWINNGSATTLKISKQSILDLESTYTWDIDADGDNDYVVYIYADWLYDEIEANGGWTYYGWTNDFGVNWYYFYLDSGDTWFAVTYGTDVDLNPTSRISSKTLQDETDSPIIPIDENDIPIDPIPDDDTIDPISDEDKDPVENPADDYVLPELPDLSLFVNDFALGSITLPETVTFMEDSGPPDLSHLIGLIGDQGESLALDFDQVDTGSPVVASIETVKPVIVDWNPQTDPIIDSDWKLIIEELFWTSEMG